MRCSDRLAHGWNKWWEPVGAKACKINKEKSSVSLYDQLRDSVGRAEMTYFHICLWKEALISEEKIEGSTVCFNGINLT